MLKVQPRLSDLSALISKVSKYPITAEELVELARQNDADPTVVDFYTAFPADEVFIDEEDLQVRTEQIAFMNQEEQEQPFELMLVPEED